MADISEGLTTENFEDKLVGLDQLIHHDGPGAEISWDYNATTVSKFNEFVNDNMDSVSGEDYLKLAVYNNDSRLPQDGVSVALNTSKDTFDSALGVIDDVNATDSTEKENLENQINALLEIDRRDAELGDKSVIDRNTDNYNAFMEKAQDLGIVEVTKADEASNFESTLEAYNWEALEETQRSIMEDVRNDIEAISKDENYKPTLDNTEYDDVYAQLLQCYNKYADTTGAVYEAIKTWPTYFEQLNIHTRGKMGDIDIQKLIFDVLNKYLWTEHFNLLGTFKNEIEEAEDVDDDGDGPKNPGGGFSSVSPGPSPTPTPNPNPGFTELMSAGTLIFTSIVPLYDQIGGTSTIQSSLTGKYEVVGLIFENGKYYYKLYDSSLKKYYYSEVTDAAQFTTSFSEVLVSKEGEETMMLSSPETEKLNFSKMTDPKIGYFIKDKVGNENQYAVVLDGSDGNTYYVPVDNSVEVVALNSIIPPTSLGGVASNAGVAAADAVGS